MLDFLFNCANPYLINLFSKAMKNYIFVISFFFFSGTSQSLALPKSCSKIHGNEHIYSKKIEPTKKVDKFIQLVKEHNIKNKSNPELHITSGPKHQNVVQENPEIKQKFKESGMPTSISGIKSYYVGQTYKGQEIKSVGDIFKLIRKESAIEIKPMTNVGEFIQFVQKLNTNNTSYPKLQITNTQKLKEVVKKNLEIKQKFKESGVPTSPQTKLNL